MALTVNPYPYQDEAIDDVLEYGNGLIAYEMGLGKTLVGIATVEELIDDINFALIIVPSNLRWQWAQSIAKFTDVDTMKKKVKQDHITIPTKEWCEVINGVPDTRDRQYERIRTKAPNFVICSYDHVVNDYTLIEELKPDLIILDEATYIKGFRAARSQAVKELGKVAEFRVALTGTPMENNPEELFSIMEFVDPDFLGTWESFEAKYIVRNKFGVVTRYRNLDVLHRKMQSIMSRKTRLDPDVAPYMPKVDHREEYVFLSKKSQKLYDKIAAEVLHDLRINPPMGTFDLAAYYAGQGGGDMSATGKIMAKVLAMQMLCDHPDLLKISAQDYVDTEGEKGSAYARSLAEAGLLDGLGESAKMLAVCEDVDRILKSHPENKIIIFSFFKDMGHMLQNALEDWDSVIYNGEMTASAKTAAKVRFQENPDCRLFIATDAAAFGVDLPEANWLLNYDLVDSAGKMDQRNARHVRAGSKHENVFVVNYLMDGTVEERRFARLNFKRRVARAVVDGKRTDVGGVIENDVDSLATFLEDMGVTV